VVGGPAGKKLAESGWAANAGCLSLNWVSRALRCVLILFLAIQSVVIGLINDFFICLINDFFAKRLINYFNDDDWLQVHTYSTVLELSLSLHREFVVRFY
jgi:hypothetical protein